ncbi:MAG: HmuY family protein [Bacteroidetes bacterium]|nr:HmuY family protein [Bacteroidota bacterium]
MKKTISKMAMALAVVVSFTACKKDSSTSVDLTNNGSYKVVVSGNVTYVQNFVADTIQGYTATGSPIGATGTRVFFSLERGEAVTDTANKTWDLAFNSSRIWINGGVSGNKMGGAYNVSLPFADVTTAINDSMKVDGATTRAIVGYDPNPGTSSSNRGWYSLTFDAAMASILTPIPGRTIVVRTASGKYAKVEIMCYYKGGVTPSVPTAKAERYYNFRYTYQANGSTTF